MADQVYSMSNAELTDRLAEYGYPRMPVTATTRKVLKYKLRSLIQNKNIRRSSPRNTDNENVMARSQHSKENKFEHGLIPIMSLTCLTDNRSRTDNNGTELSQNRFRTPSNQLENKKHPLLVPEPLINFNSNNNNPYVMQEVLQSSSNKPEKTETYSSIFNPTPELPSFNPANTENKTDGNRENAIHNTFRTSEANTSGSSNYTFAPDLSTSQKRKNMNDDEKGMQNVIRALTTQQEKGFQELVCNLNSKMHDIFENISNIQGENFEALLSSINASKQDLYQKMSEEQGKYFNNLLTNFTRKNQETVEILSIMQDEKFQVLISRFSSTKKDIIQTLTKHQDMYYRVLVTKLKQEKKDICEKLYNQQNRQFQELLTNLNFIKEQNDELSKRFDTLTLKYDDVLKQIKNLEMENVDQKRYIEKLEKSLDLHEKKTCLSCLEIKIPKLKEENSETKEDLCIFVKKLGKAVGVEIETSNIRDISRLHNGESPVVIEFTSVLIKEALVSAIKRMKEDKLKNLQLCAKDQFLELPTSTLFFSIFFLISTLCALFLLCIF